MGNISNFIHSMRYPLQINYSRHIIGVVLLMLAVLISGQAQVTIQPRPIEPAELGILYNTEQVMTFKAYPRGLALGMYKAEIKTYYKTTFYSVEVGYVKHHKEVRQSNELAALFRGEENPRPYIYGKQNSLYTIRGGYGIKRYYSEKARRKGLSVGVIYQGGVTIGMLKPNYLKLIKRLENNSYAIVSEKYSEENRDLFLDPFSIYGGTSFTKGLGEVKFIPGVHGMAGVHFAFGAFEEYVMALDAGIMVDVFPRQVPIMVEDNKPYFINLFLNLHIGKRK